MSPKSFAAGLVLAASTLAVATPASADGFYISAFAGLSWQEDQSHVRTE